MKWKDLVLKSLFLWSGEDFGSLTLSFLNFIDNMEISQLNNGVC